MSDANTEIETLRQQAETELAAVSTTDQLEQFRIKYLGTKGKLKDAMKLLGSASQTENRRSGSESMRLSKASPRHSTRNRPR